MQHLSHITETGWSPTHPDCMRATCRECGAFAEAFISLVDSEGRWIGDPADRWAAIRASENVASRYMAEEGHCPPRCQATETEYDQRTRTCNLLGHVEVAWSAHGRAMRHCSRCGCGLEPS